MPRISQYLHAFNAGEIAPEFQGRLDTTKYRFGAKRIENFIVRPEGGIFRRPGSRFVQEVMDSTKKSRLIPFTFSTEQAYVLEFSEFLIRVFANESQIGVAERGFIHNALPDEFAYDVEPFNHGYSDGQGPFHITATPGIPGGLVIDTDYWISHPKTLTFTEADVSTGADTITFGAAHEYSPNQGPFRLTAGTSGTSQAEFPTPLEAATDYFILVSSPTVIQLSLTAGGAAIDLTDVKVGTTTLAPTADYLRHKFRFAASQGGVPIDTTAGAAGEHTITPNPDGSPVGLPIEIVTPYTEAELFELQYAQSADFLFIAHKNHRPVQLTRSSETQWALDFVNIVDGPYDSQNIDSAITLQPSGTTGFINLTYVGKTWTVSDIGRIVRIQHGSAPSLWGIAEITEIKSTTTARALVISEFGATTASDVWRLGTWFPGNNPRAISFFEQRLGFAGEPNSPQSLHGSETSSFNGFSPTDLDAVVLDTHAVNYGIATNQVNAILWMSFGSQLIVGTADALFAIRGSFDGEPITPFNINIDRIATFGVLSVRPVTISGQLVYVTANSQSLRGLQSSQASDAVPPADITLLAKHIFGRTIAVADMAYQQDRQQVLWVVRGDGEIAAVTYVPEQAVFAWHRHTLGGSFDGGAAVVESIAVIPSPDNTHDQVWLTVKRTVNSATVRHVEFFEDEWLDGDVLSMRYVDSAPAAFSGSPTSTIGGLEHLEGEVVQVLADGDEHPDRTVSSGSITLDDSYSDVVVGLKYTSELETLNLDLPDPEGSATGKMARLDHLVLRFFETMLGEFGPDVDHLDAFNFKEPELAPEDPAPPFTGDKKVSFQGPFEREKVFVLRQDKPFPMNVLSVNVIGSTGPR